jgi:hypothetical protein
MIIVSQTISEAEWRKLFSFVLNYTVQQGEYVNDVLDGSYIIGRKRSVILKREFYVSDDVPFVLAMFCWWPFKPIISEMNSKFLLTHRGRAFRGASERPDVQSRLSNIVPEGILGMGYDGLFQILAEERLDVMLPRLINHQS